LSYHLYYIFSNKRQKTASNYIVLKKIV